MFKTSKERKMKYLLIIPILIIILSTNAEVITDGTLGQQINLPGSNFQITSDLGQQHGGNLFHSFQDFNLNSLESATFSGPNNIQNILSRVTGGNPSNIDGLIHSTIPNTNFYFINPHGIVFGENFQLDVQGGFHASTADYLRLGTEGRFNARQPSESLLTVAPVEAFGFLTNNPAPITMQNPNLYSYDDLSFIGGEININGVNGQFPQVNKEDIVSDETPKLEDVDFSSSIITEFGQIKFASMNSTGEFNNLELNGNGGQVTINNTQIYNIEDNFLAFADKLVMNNSGIFNDQGEYIDIKVNNLHLIDSIIVSGIEQGKAANINIQASSSIDLQNSIIVNTPINEDVKGQGGNININTQQLSITDNSYIISDIKAGEIGGNIAIKADNILINSGSFIGSMSESVEITGKAGDIYIEANNMQLIDGTAIINATFGSGDSGTTTIKVSGILEISGVIYEDEEVIPGGIINLPPPNLIIAEKCPTCDLKKDTALGKTGPIEIQAGEIILTDGATISSATYGSSDAGIITITADTLTIVGTDLINSSINSESPIAKPEAGNAGDIKIQANRINLIDGGEINTSTANAAGGNITIKTQNLIYLKNGQITTSANGGKDNGGNITIDNLTFIVLNNGQIKAQANKGHGGDIRISAEQFITSSNSVISASSKLGLDGNIEITSPDMNMEGFLVVLSDDVMDISHLMKTPCGQRLGENLSSFVVNPSEGSHSSPDDLLPSGPLLSDNLPVKEIVYTKSSDKKLAFSTCKNF